MPPKAAPAARQWIPAFAGMTKENAGMTKRNAGMTGGGVPQEVIVKNGGWVYIMTNHKMGTLYIGSTSDVYLRVAQHREKFFHNAFTAKYGLNKLVYLEFWNSLKDMVKRERQLKKWERNWKIKLIVQKNPEWKDLYQEFLDETIPAEHWIPAFAGMTKEEVKAYNKQLRDKEPVIAGDDERGS